MKKTLPALAAFAIIASIGAANAATMAPAPAVKAPAAAMTMKKPLSKVSMNQSVIYNAGRKTVHFTYAPAKGKSLHYALAGGHSTRLDCAQGGKLMMGKSTETCPAKAGKITIRNGAFDS